MDRVREEVRRACRSASDPIALHRAVAELLPAAVPFDRWCGLVLDPATLLLTSGYHADGLPQHLLPRLMQIEAADADVIGMTALARDKVGVSTIDRATQGKPHTSERYRDVLAPAGLGRELRAVLRERGNGWGGFILLRDTAAPDFNDAEVTLVAQMTEDFARGIRRCLLQSEFTHRNDSAMPGMLVIARASLDVELATAAATHWLTALEAGADASRLPLTATALVARARTSPEGLARARARTGDGQWLTLYAEATTGGADAQVAVVIEPTRPYELAAIMAEAYLLTPRERDVAQHILLGHSTDETATALSLSGWTVQDHLKAIYAKTGASCRSDLGAMVLGR
jgi:DNA-binding HTH domain-containing proteins